jgi:mono/diheme cytochrome c family protein
VLASQDGTIRGRNPYADQQGEFIASTDERFRPVNFATGPDGALYIVDLYRGVLQHRISLTTYLREQSEARGLADPQHLGRIYRVVPADKPAARTGTIAALTTAQWVEKLGHPNAWWRETAQRLLVEKRDSAVTPAIRAVALKSPQPLGRVHALWTLEGVGALGRGEVIAALDHADAVVRVAGLRLSEPFLKGSGAERAEVLGKVRRLARDKSPEVQLQAVLALGAVRDPATDLAVAEIVRATPQNTYLRDAFFSGLADRELPLLERLVSDPAWSAEDAEANKILTGLARGVYGTRQLPAIERLFALSAASVKAGAGKRAVALLDGMAPGVGASRRPLQFAQQPAGWTDLEANATAKARLAKLNDLVVWPGKPGVAAAAEVKPLTAEQQKRFAAGKDLFSAVCAACHQATGRGLDGLAPPLLDSEWVLGPPERPVRIVLKGIRGNITVLGRMHTGDMPAFGAALDDSQIASILTFLRREWGHTASPIDPDFVKAQRAATANHPDAWSAEELTLHK